jgi:nucleotide-binding universal stress UspA family protein
MPQLKSVLLATDFSPAASEAVAFAYSLLGRGGAVHLVHVLRGGAGGSVADTESVGRQLRELVPVDAGNLDKHTHTHVLVSDDTAGAICRVAEQVGAEAVCLGTQGKSRSASGALGSVALRVLALATTPVLLIRERRAESRPLPRGERAP